MPRGFILSRCQISKQSKCNAFKIGLLQLDDCIVSLCKLSTGLMQVDWQDFLCTRLFMHKIDLDIPSCFNNLQHACNHQAASNLISTDLMHFDEANRLDATCSAIQKFISDYFLFQYELAIVRDGEEPVISTPKMLETNWDVAFYVK